MNFDIIDEIEHVEIIARESGIRDLKRLQKTYGPRAGKIFEDETYLSFSAWITDLTGVKLKPEDYENAGYRP